MILGNQEIIIFAMDFDGTITKKSEWPELGEPNWDVINAIKRAQASGAKFILWTNREDTDSKHPGCLTKAIKFCKECGITFDAINENLPIVGDYYDSDVRKISADYYIDDKSPGSIEWFLRSWGGPPPELSLEYRYKLPNLENSRYDILKGEIAGYIEYDITQADHWLGQGAYDPVLEIKLSGDMLPFTVKKYMDFKYQKVIDIGFDLGSAQVDCRGILDTVRRTINVSFRFMK